MAAFKLIHFVDDIRSASKAQTRELFPYCTCPTSTIEQKGMKPMEVDEFSNIIITGNDKSPLYVDSNDRRQVLMTVNPEMKGNL